VKTIAKVDQAVVDSLIVRDAEHCNVSCTCWVTCVEVF